MEYKDNWTAGLTGKERFGGKELETEHGLNLYDQVARQYDMTKGGFNTMDPLCEKYYWISPYAYCANNPMRFIDPTGMDWYEDEDGSYQYDPDLDEKNQDKRIKKGQRYIGKTAAVNDSNGNLFADFRADGSIMFKNETAAYSRMWTQANRENREQFAVIGDKSVLVLPEFKNDNTTATPEQYGYSWDNGNIKDANGNTFKTIGTIHTHQDDLDGKWGFIAAPGFDDQKYFPYKTPNKPYFTMGYDGKIHGEVGDYQGRQDISKLIPKGYNTVNNLLKGAKFQLLLKLTFKQ